MSHDDDGARRSTDDRASDDLGRVDRTRVDRAKGAAQEAIGKLIGDDAEVRKGRAARENGEPPANEHDE